MLLIIAGTMVACKGQKKVTESTDATEKPALPGPGELNPNEAIMNVEITKALQTSVLANFVSLEKQSFGFKSNLIKGQEIEITDVPDNLRVFGAIGRWVVEEVEAPGKTLYQFVRENEK